MRCLWCGKALEAKTPRRRYCNDACRSRAWQKKKAGEVSAALGEIEAAAQRIRGVVGREEMSEDSD